MYQVIEFLEDELRAAEDKARYRKLDQAIDCLVRKEEEIEVLHEALEEIKESTRVHTDMEQPKKRSATPSKASMT